MTEPTFQKPVLVKPGREDPAPPAPSSPIFVLGTQRSGTTLLFQVLNGLPDLHLVNEFWDLFDLLAGDIDRGQLIARLVSDLELGEEDRRHLTQHGGTPFALAEAAFAARARARGKSAWGLKDPRLSEFLPLFADRFPEACFVVLLRDPRAVVASMITRKMNVANVLAGAELWRRQVELQEAFVAEQPGRALWVRFEELVQDLPLEMQRICNFIGHPYDEQLLQYYERTPETDLHAGNRNIAAPPNRKTIDRWKSRLRSRQVDVVEAITQPLAERLGYPTSRPQTTVSALHRAGYRLHQRTMTALWWQRRTGWSGVKKRLGLPYDSRPKLG